MSGNKNNLIKAADNRAEKYQEKLDLNKIERPGYTQILVSECGFSKSELDWLESLKIKTIHDFSRYNTKDLKEKKYNLGTYSYIKKIIDKATDNGACFHDMPVSTIKTQYEKFSNFWKDKNAKMAAKPLSPRPNGDTIASTREVKPLQAFYRVNPDEEENYKPQVFSRVSLEEEPEFSPAMIKQLAAEKVGPSFSITQQEIAAQDETTSQSIPKEIATELKESKDNEMTTTDQNEKDDGVTAEQIKEVHDEIKAFAAARNMTFSQYSKATGLDKTTIGKAFERNHLLSLSSILKIYGFENQKFDDLNEAYMIKYGLVKMAEARKEFNAKPVPRQSSIQTPASSKQNLNTTPKKETGQPKAVSLNSASKKVEVISKEQKLQELIVSMEEKHKVKLSKEDISNMEVHALFHVKAFEKKMTITKFSQVGGVGESSLTCRFTDGKIRRLSLETVLKVFDGHQIDPDELPQTYKDEFEHSKKPVVTVQSNDNDGQCDQTIVAGSKTEPETEAVMDERTERAYIIMGEMLDNKGLMDKFMTPIKDLPLDPKTECLKRFAQNGKTLTIVGQIAEQSSKQLLEKKVSGAMVSHIESGLKSLGLELGYLDKAYAEVDRLDEIERKRKELELQKQKEEQEKIVNTQTMYYSLFKKNPKP